MNLLDRVDQFQRRHPVLGFPLGVIYKFFDDQGPYQAAALTYYAFVAIFPLMLLGTSILGLVLRDHPDLQQQLLDSALSQFPIIGEELGRPHGLQGSFTVVVVGVLTALYGAMGLGQGLQNVQHLAWSVPRNSRPNPFMARLKTLFLLIVAGAALLVLTLVITVITTTDLFDGLGRREKWLIQGASLLVLGWFLSVLLRFAATGEYSRLRRAAPGGFVLALMWQVLQFGGAEYVNRVLIGTSEMNKTFGLVLGLLGFLYIGAVMAMLAIEVNVVLTRRLFPRALLTPFTDHVLLTDADRRAYALYARMQRHKGFERVRVDWEPSPRETVEPPIVDPAAPEASATAAAEPQEPGRG